MELLNNGITALQGEHKEEGENSCQTICKTLCAQYLLYCVCA